MTPLALNTLGLGQAIAWVAVGLLATACAMVAPSMWPGLMIRHPRRGEIGPASNDQGTDLEGQW
jgi:hypothetical protein